jgi:hypothetical protein
MYLVLEPYIYHSCPIHWAVITVMNGRAVGLLSGASSRMATMYYGMLRAFTEHKSFQSMN